MKRERYPEEKIISILKEHDAGDSAPDLSRRYRTAENTIHRCKAKFGGMEVSEAKKLRELQENSRFTEHGKLIQTMTLIDEYTRECPPIHVAWRIRARCVIYILADVMQARGVLTCLRFHAD